MSLFPVMKKSGAFVVYTFNPAYAGRAKVNPTVDFSVSMTVPDYEDIMRVVLASKGF